MYPEEARAFTPRRKKYAHLDMQTILGSWSAKHGGRFRDHHKRARKLKTDAQLA